MNENTQIYNYLTAIVQMVRQMNVSHVGDYCSIDDFILKNGRNWNPQKLPKGFGKGKLKNCFQNAAELALDDSRLVYCEGYARGIIPVHHAWCLDKKGNVIDTTWAPRQGVTISPGIEYFGVAIKTEYLRKHLLKTEYYGVIDAWRHHWPILKSPAEAWRDKLNDISM